MMGNYPKNSLLGQLESNGIIQNDSLKAQDGGNVPFGNLTVGGDDELFVDEFENEFYEKQEEHRKSSISKKRLNDLDVNIFQTSNGVDIDDVELSDTQRAQKIKALIKKIDEKIFMLEDSDDEIMLKKLKDEKEALLFTLYALSGENKGAVFNSIGEIGDKIKGFEKIIFNLFPILRKNYLVKGALRKLVMLNENAKELMSKKIPYGESEGRYSDFAAYLNCANAIQSKLAKKIH